MKSILFIPLLLIIAISADAQSCPCCSGGTTCSALAFNSPDVQNNLLGLRYSYSKFEGTTHALVDDELLAVQSRLYVQRADLFYNFKIIDHLQGSVDLPYVMNQLNQLEISNQTNSGFGDVQANLQYMTTLRSKSDSSNWSNQLRFRLGTSAPTGHFVVYNGTAETYPNFQHGTGNWSLQLGGTHVISYKNSSLLTNINYSNYFRRNDYKTGALIQVSSGVYHKFEMSKFSIQPNLSIVYERENQNETGDSLIHDSGFHRWSVLPGVIFNYNHFNAQVNADIPFSDFYSGTQLVEDYLIQVSVGYSFK